MRNKKFILSICAVVFLLVTVQMSSHAVAAYGEGITPLNQNSSDELPYIDGTADEPQNKPQALIYGSIGDEEINERMRSLNGRIEELEYKLKRIEESVNKISADLDLRIKDIEEKYRQAEKPDPATDASNTAPAIEMQQPGGQDKNIKKPDDTSTGAPKENKPKTPQEQYSKAFKLLNAAKFDEAKKLLTEFTQVHPSDQLIGNAYYWLGEISYVKRDYVEAADNFKKGFENRPDGPKAPDNLLKLGMSLSAQGKGQEACKILGILPQKFNTISASLKQAAQSERKRIGCK